MLFYASIAMQEQDRPGNELLILSGANGELIGDKKFPTPDSKETYCIPVVYEQSDQSQYIMFGTGGESIAGKI